MIQWIPLVAAGLLLSIPFVLLQDNLRALVNTPLTTQELLFLLQRAAGLFAFTLIFIQIVLGSGRDLLSQIYPASDIIKIHRLIGKIAFALVLAHPLLIIITPNLFFTFWQQDSLAISLGITALVLILITVPTAIWAANIGLSWIKIHRLNYLVFALIIIHSRRIGVDTGGSLIYWWYISLGVIAAGLFARKLWLWFNKGNTTTPPLDIPVDIVPRGI